MNENEKQYLAVARELLKEGKVEDACCHYFKAGEENPQNAEAEFFGAYLGYQSLIKENNGTSAANAFAAMVLCIEKAVKSVKESEGDMDEKLVVLTAMVEVYTPVTRFLFTNRFAAQYDRTIIGSGVQGLYKLGSAIKNEFGADHRAMKIAIEPWKEGVALQQKFYAYDYNGVKAEDMATEIQKVDPTYVMPNKAGCISLAK